MNTLTFLIRGVDEPNGPVFHAFFVFVSMHDEALARYMFPGYGPLALRVLVLLGQGHGVA